MTAATIGMRELHLSTRAVLETVRERGSVVITDRGRPIARIVALDDDEAAMVEAGATLAARPRFTVPTRRVPPGTQPASEALRQLREGDRG